MLPTAQRGNCGWRKHERPMLVAGAKCVQCKGQGSGPPSGQSGPHKCEVTRFAERLPVTDRDTT